MEAYFFQEHLTGETTLVTLDETNSRHCVQVLRMAAGATVRLTDGKGNLAIAVIEDANKKCCLVRIKELKVAHRKYCTGFSIGIVFTKSNERNEWLLEKLTEIGTENIYPLLSNHGERNKFNPERYQKILISALLQSQQTLLPAMHPVQKLSKFLTDFPAVSEGQHFIAHCIENTEERTAFTAALQKDKKCLILIGPEGDFSAAEIRLALQKDFQPVHFGNNRLRTETAGVYACAAYHSFQLSDF